MRGEARKARIELRVGEAPLAGEVDHRLLVRRPASEMRDPSVVANRQGFLRRSAVLRRLIDHKHAPDRGGLASRHFQDWAGRVPMRSCGEWLRRSQTQLVDLAAPCARHCEPTGRANARPMTGSAKQSMEPRKERMDCFVASLLAMTTNIGLRSRRALRAKCHQDVIAGPDPAIHLLRESACEADGCPDQARA